MEAGSEVDLSIEERDLVMRVLRPAALPLDELLAAVTPANVHEAVELGGPVGREVW